MDAITRAAQPALAKALGHTIIVDNQAGAGGIVGLQALARSAPDGFSLSVVSNNVVIFPSVLTSVPFDMPGDFTPIAVVGSTPVLLVVNAKLPANNASELIALLKAIGVTTAQRVPAAPNVPTFVEQGLPNYVVEAWFGVLGPKGMAAADVQRVHAALASAFADPAVKEWMAKQGMSSTCKAQRRPQRFSAANGQSTRRW